MHIAGTSRRLKESKDSRMPTTSKPAERKSAAKSKPRERPSSDAARKRQSDRLDEALLETFPASDSVSIGRVK